MRKLIQTNLLPLLLVVLAVFLLAWFSFSEWEQATEFSGSNRSASREFFWEVLTRPFAWSLG